MAPESTDSPTYDQRKHASRLDCGVQLGWQDRVQDGIDGALALPYSGGRCGVLVRYTRPERWD